MNRSNLIESLEDRQLFSAYTLTDCMVSSFRAPEPQAVSVHDITVTKFQEPQRSSYSWGVTQTGAY